MAAAAMTTNTVSAGGAATFFEVWDYLGAPRYAEFQMYTLSQCVDLVDHGWGGRIRSIKVWMGYQCIFFTDRTCRYTKFVMSQRNVPQLKGTQVGTLYSVKCTKYTAP